MIFSRSKIQEALKKNDIIISPFSEENLRDASYVLHLELPEPILLTSNTFIKLKTIEKITLSSQVACFVTTHGDAAREGIDAVQSSLFCEPNTNSQMILEISNATKESIKLEPGMKIAKAIFMSVI